jgi:hypothetical protein
MEEILIGNKKLNSEVHEGSDPPEPLVLKVFPWVMIQWSEMLSEAWPS